MGATPAMAADRTVENIHDFFIVVPSMTKVVAAARRSGGLTAEVTHAAKVRQGLFEPCATFLNFLSQRRLGDGGIAKGGPGTGKRRSSQAGLMEDLCDTPIAGYKDWVSWRRGELWDALSKLSG